MSKLILLGEPIVFRAGSALILGSFKIHSQQLVIELAQIEGGGEGVLPSLASLARRYAKLHGLSGIEWIVHAVSCANPNMKLRRVLERRGFAVKQLADVGEVYHLLDFFDKATKNRFLTNVNRHRFLSSALSPKGPQQLPPLPPAPG